MLELADRPALHAGDHPGRPGPIPGRGTLYSSTEAIMAKAAKRKPAKRRPKDERLRITEDPQTALTRLLKAPPAKKRGK